MKILVVDIETTGFEVKNDAIVEIGIVLVDTTTKEFEVVFDEPIQHKGKFKLGRHRDSWIFQNTTLTVDDVINAKPLDFYHERIQNLFDTYQMTVYNKSFDVRFLTSAGFKLNHIKCLMKTARKYSKYRFPNGKIKTPSVEEIYKQFFLTESETYFEKHRAGSDAIDEAKILLHMVQLKENPTKIKEEITVIQHGEKKKTKNGLKMSDTLNFGKYKGYVLSDVVTLDKPYLKWCMFNIPKFKLSPEVSEMLSK